VTLAVFLTGELPWITACLNVVAQIAGSVLAGGIACSFLNTVGYPALSPDFTSGSGFLCEFMCTTALTFVVCSVAIPSAQAKNSFFGLAIGTTVLAGFLLFNKLMKVQLDLILLFILSF